MTDISVASTSYQSEKRSWLIGSHGTDPGATPTITLDVSAFTAATHYPNGYLLSGIVLGRITATGLYAPYVDANVDGITATGLYAPYLSTNSDGTQTAAGILFSSVKVPNLADLTKDVANAMLVHGFVAQAKLPIVNAATGGGYIDTAGITALKLIHFSTVTP
jgi:hypothetical protein